MASLMDIPGIGPFLATRQQMLNEGAQRQQQQMGLMGLMAQMERQAQEREMAPLRMEQLRGQLDMNRQHGALYAAQAAEHQRRALAGEQQEAARAELANTLTQGFQGVQGEGAPPPSAVMMNEAAALRAAQEADARGEQVRIDVPNPARVQGLAVRADPARAIPELLRQQRAPTPSSLTANYKPVAGGYLKVNADGSETFVRTAPDARVPPEPLHPVMVDGKPVLLPRSDAVGKPPAATSGREEDANVRRVLQFSAVLDKAGFNETYSTLEEATKRVTPETVKYLTGPG